MCICWCMNCVNCACDCNLRKHKRAITGCMWWMCQLLWKLNANKIKTLGKLIIKQKLAYNTLVNISNLQSSTRHIKRLRDIGDNFSWGEYIPARNIGVEIHIFNLKAPCVLYIGKAFHYSPENAFYIFIIYLINKYISLSDICLTVHH